MTSNKTLILQIVDKNGSISLLRKRGLSHSQIAILIDEQVKDGYIEIANGTMSLTNSGRAFLYEGMKANNFAPKRTWILPQEHLHKKPISKDIIILPKKKNI